MAVAYIKHRAWCTNRKINRCAFNDFVEIHVAAVAAGIARAGWRLRRSRRGRNATEHRPQRNGVACEMFRGFLWCRDAFCRVQMPANILTAVFAFDGEVAVNAAIDNVVVAHRPIAVQAQADNVHDKRVAGNRRFNIERPRFRIASKNACHPFFVGAACVHCCRVNGIARRNRKHGFI